MAFYNSGSVQKNFATVCPCPEQAVPPLIDTFLSLRVGVSYNEIGIALPVSELYAAYVQFLRSLSVVNAVSETSSLENFTSYMRHLSAYWNHNADDGGGKVKRPDYWEEPCEHNDGSAVVVHEIDGVTCITGLFLTSRRLRNPLEREWNSAAEFFDAVDSDRWKEKFHLPFFRGAWSDQKGYRAIATRDIGRGDILAEYKGSLTAAAELEQREVFIYYANLSRYPEAAYKWRGGKSWDPYKLYDGTNIDITLNYGAWLNKPDLITVGGRGLDCSEANCKVCKYTEISGRVRLYVQSIKDIGRSYELLQDYHQQWW